MLRRGIYLLGSVLLRRNAFTFHLAMKPMLSQGPRVFKTPCFRFASELPSHEVLKVYSSITKDASPLAHNGNREDREVVQEAWR